MLIVNPETPLEHHVVEVLRVIDTTTKELGIASLLVGATARDVIMYHVFGRRPSRASHDVDFALLVDGWGMFGELKNRLLSTGQFSAEKGSTQRMYYRQKATSYEFMVDLIPFGGVENDAHQIVWPPEMSMIMNMAGFRDVHNASSKVQVEPGLVIDVASLPGLSILKLMAWVDRNFDRDASDIVDLLRSYEIMGNQERIYTTDNYVLEAVGYDPELMGAWILGHDAAEIASKETREIALAVLNDQKQMERLCNDMAKALRSRADGLAHAKRIIELYRDGLASIE